MGFFAMVGPLQVFVSCHVSRVPYHVTLFPPLPPPSIYDEHMHRDNRSFGNVDLCGNDLVVIDRLVPDPLLLISLIFIRVL